MSLFRRLSFNWMYFREPPWDTGVSPPELLEFIAAHPAGRALDLGCGTGTNAITLARHGWQVTGVDFVGRAVRIARQKAHLAGVSIDFRVEDVTHLGTITGPFEFVLDIGCFHSLAMGDKVRYVRRLKQLLAPSGTYLMYGFFHQTGESGPGLTEDDLILFDKDFTLVTRKDGTERGLRPSAWFDYRRIQKESALDSASPEAI
jgi:SAM-dependent methyltransferase